ncbi:putative divalent cation/proton antiporter TMEM165 [Oratosquilla oratoria]|uniref:putative divalent cation/proton antiporter TMEM165 n=1 Tax=Oratosquilla oratoria TaxID=337810 RepID=UPI003F75AFA5
MSSGVVAKMSRIVLALTIVGALGLHLTAAEIHPIDVEPVARKEHPDFEPITPVDNSTRVAKEADHPHRPEKKDDTGNAPPPADQPAQNEEVESLLSKYTPGGKSDMSFTHGFIASLCIIIVSELGDKTFFIAAIMAMNHPRLTVFSGAMTALAFMHIMSALFGYIITVIPRVYTFYASSALFAIFGIKMLREGLRMRADEGQEELEEVQSDLRRQEDDYQKEPLEEGGGGIRGRLRRNRILKIVSRVFMQAFVLTFLAEWGDRSQIATVVMAAREDVGGVIVGGLIGHFMCTGLAVIGGRMIAQKISIRTVTIIGGVVFLIFALSALVMGP